MFALNLVNSYGNSQIIELVNDGNPIKIKCKNFWINNFILGCGQPVIFIAVYY